MNNLTKNDLHPIRLLSFDYWMQCVNARLLALCGMGVEDLPDCAYRDWYDSGLSSARAAKRVIANAKDF